jgi:hypothetical protein
MNDDQCDAIIKAIKSLSNAVSISSENIVNAIENMSIPDGYQIANQLFELNKSIDAIIDAAQRFESRSY